MITPELIGYVRGEVAKGRKREDIHSSLVKEGGWSEADLSEAFRIVIPMQSFGENSLNPAAPARKFALPPNFLKISLIVVIIAAIGFGIWFYRAPLAAFWNSAMAKMSSLIPKKTDTAEDAPTAPNNTATNPPAAIATSVKDCGTTTAPDLKKTASYQNNAVLNCLANSALVCENAKAAINDPLFPNVFKVVKNGGSCKFELSYSGDSTLVDGTGASLASQYISCPVSIVRAVDETKNPPVFSAPSTDNLGKYVGQMYFYGILGVFIQSNLDKSMIQAMGCSGPYIDSVIDSYRQAQAS